MQLPSQARIDFAQSLEIINVQRGAKLPNQFFEQMVANPDLPI
jgi:hypothetical protein